MQRRGAKSIVYDFVLSRGVVFSRAATTLRSIETKPFDWKICPLWTDNIFRSCRRGSVSFTSRTSGWPFSGAQSRRAGRFIFLFLDPGVCAQEALLREDLENFRLFFASGLVFVPTKSITGRLRVWGTFISTFIS